MQHEETVNLVPVWVPDLIDPSSIAGMPAATTFPSSRLARTHGDAKPRRKFLFNVPSCAARALRAPAIAWSVSKTVERNFDVCKFLCAFILTMRMQHEEFVDLFPVVVPDLTVLT